MYSSDTQEHKFNMFIFLFFIKKYGYYWNMISANFTLEIIKKDA